MTFKKKTTRGRSPESFVHKEKSKLKILSTPVDSNNTSRDYVKMRF